MTARARMPDEKRRQGAPTSVQVDIGSVFPELRPHLPARRTANVTAERIPRGPWVPGDHDGSAFCWLVVGGILIRRLSVAGGSCTEILGRGDVIRPWDAGSGEPLLDVETAWTVIEPMLLVRCPRTAGAAPLLALAIDAAVERAHRLAVQMAVASQVGVDRRVLLILEHLADRWGHVRRDGLVIPIRLSHGVLAQLVGARRPTVSAAIGLLDRQGQLRRLPDGSWLLPTPTAAPVAR